MEWWLDCEVNDGDGKLVLNITRSSIAVIVRMCLEASLRSLGATETTISGRAVGAAGDAYETANYEARHNERRCQRDVTVDKDDSYVHMHSDGFDPYGRWTCYER